VRVVINDLDIPGTRVEEVVDLLIVNLEVADGELGVRKLKEVTADIAE
jgi:hypothetical protein